MNYGMDSFFFFFPSTRVGEGNGSSAFNQKYVLAISLSVFICT